MKKFLLVFLGLFAVAGCADVTTAQLRDMRNEFANKQYTESANAFADNKDISDQHNLELLITGLSEFQAKNYSQSDAAFEEFNRRNTDTTAGSITREATMMVGGRLVSEYKPYMMDSLFVSYYQIWDAIGDGRRDDVRVIINQSYARQQDMSRAYASMVEKRAEKLSAQTAEVRDTLEQQSALWAPYSDIMNPALMYLSGIWFLNAGDFSDATLYLKRAYGMSNNNSFIETDLKLAESNQKPTDTTWVFIESGFAPMLQQETTTVPVLTNDGIIITSIAIAKPVFWNGNMTLAGAKPLADVNAMFMTEFNQYNVNDVLRAVASATARTIAQAAAYNSDNKYSALLGLASTITSVATNNAEVRSWVTLPASISVLRLKTANLIKTNLRDMVGDDIRFPKSGNYLMYVRLAGDTTNAHLFKI